MSFYLHYYKYCARDVQVTFHPLFGIVLKEMIV
jgi:hypothetical protein